MTTFSEADHPRSGNGQFTTKEHSEAGISLGPAPSEDITADIGLEGYYSNTPRKERAEKMTEDLNKAIANVVASGRLTEFFDYLRTTGMNKTWSFNNRALATMQLFARQKELGIDPDVSGPAAMMMGKKQWEEKYNRHLVAGCKAIWISAPVFKKRTEKDKVTGEENEKKVFVGTTPVAVFNIVDTDGDPVPSPDFAKPYTHDASEETVDRLTKLIEAEGYTFTEKEIPGADPANGRGPNGYTTMGDVKHVVVDSRLPGTAAKAKTCIHELAHIKCGHLDVSPEEYAAHQGHMETEAELTAYLVSRDLGILPEDDQTPYAADYIATWSKGDPDVVHKAMDKAFKSYMQIMDGFSAFDEDKNKAETTDKTPELAGV